MRESALDVEAFAVPAQQRVDGESMANVVKARATGLRWASQADLPRELHEGLAERGGCDPGAMLGEKEGWISGMRAETITLVLIRSQRLASRLVNGNVPRFDITLRATLREEC